MENMREFTYKVKGLETANGEIVDSIKADFEGVKGVVGISINVDEGTISYALDQWASDYDSLCKLNEICANFNLELIFADEETVVQEFNTGESVDVEETVIDEGDTVEDEEPTPVKKGKLTKGDFIEKIIIFGVSVILTVVGLFVKGNETFKSWIFMLGFTIASYETLYNAVVKVSEKKYILEDVITFVGALIFMYLGYTVSATLIMICYGIVSFIPTYTTHRLVVESEKLEAMLNETEDENDKNKINQKIEFLSGINGICDSKTAKIIFNKLKYGIITIVVALILTFVPPFFNIKNYSYELTSTWLYVGASVLVIGGIGNIIFTLINIATVSIWYAKKQGVEIRDYNAYLDLSSAKGVCFDKTGVLTTDEGQVVEIIGEDKDYILSLASSVVKNSRYHIAKAILNYAKDVKTLSVSDLTESYGSGISCIVNGETVLLGNTILMKKNGVEIELVKSGNSVVYLAKGGKYIGAIVISYPLKKDSFGAAMEIKEDIELKVTVVSSEETMQVASIKDELVADGGLSRANSTKKASYANSNGFIYVGNGVYDKNTLMKTEKSISFGEDGNICVEVDEVNKIPFIIKLANRSNKLLKMVKCLPLLVKVVLIVILAIIRVFTGADAMWWIAIIDLICSLGTILLSYVNGTEVI